MKTVKPYLLNLIFFIFGFAAMGQNISFDSLHKQKLFQVSGGINVTASNYIGNSLQGKEPFNYYANGNLNFSFLDISLPISFNYSNQKFSYSYTQPFNQFSFHPTYRWAQGHVGWCSSSFSPYSLSGHSYYGTGIDLKIPKTNIVLTAMYGRLLKAIEGDTVNTIVDKDTSKNIISPVFKRMGYGAKIAYAKKNKSVTVSYFKAFDEKKSITTEAGNYGVFAEKNNVITINGSTVISKNLKLTAELGTSFIQKEALRNKTIVYDPSEDVGKIIDSFTHSAFRYNAVKANANYTVPKTFTTFGVGYEHIDPGYRTLGAYFFNNDLQTLNINFAQQILKGKVGINGSIGTQKDDLKKQKTNRTNRILHNYAINIVPTTKFNINASYSNFTSFSLIKDKFREITTLLPQDNWDTLSRYAQVAQTASAGISYALSNDKAASQHVNINFSFNDTKEIVGSVVKGAAAAKVYCANIGYNISLGEIKTVITIAANYMRNQYAAGNAEATGATLVFTKPLFAMALPINFSASYNATKQSGIKSGGVCNLRLSTNYAIMKKHNISLSMMALIRKSAGTSGQPAKTIYENASQLAYSYSF